MNLVGKLLGNRYEIIEKIGNGGMATVYKARCLVLKRYVAVKVLREEYTTDNEFIKRFNIEAESAASLTHPNIVSVYDVGQEGNLYYIVMELIKGKTLKEIIVEQGKLGWKWSLKVAIQIASALETAHRNNIIHRDIKPHNIIITEDGTAKVTDFGIAKAVSNSTITAFGKTIGSVHYFSPEHARGGFTDAKSDIYSLGVVMYEMITGKVYHAESAFCKWIRIKTCSCVRNTAYDILIAILCCRGLWRRLQENRTEQMYRSREKGRNEVCIHLMK